MSAAISNTAAATSTALTNPPNRLEQTTVCLPLVYGSIAFYLGKEADEFQTHQWTLFLRGPNNEDLSLVISKVVFQLHASFAEPTREQTSPPFELTEKGWGEFEAQIRVYWKDPLEQHVMVSTVVLHPVLLEFNDADPRPESPCCPL
jgi:YEATS domain-containing protein 4